MLINNDNAVATRDFTRITANFSGPVRHDTMGGREYKVVPMVMMLEGVLNGDHGPILYPEEEIAKFPSAWNSRPVVAYHPEQGVSASNPDIITNRGIGVVMNAKWEDGKLKAEAWCEVSRMEIVDNRILDAVQNNKMLELSTGLYIEPDRTPGEFNGKSYDIIARNFQPDHIAVLPDIKGACSIEDGAGFLRLNSENSKVLIDVSKMTEDQRNFIASNDKSFIAKLGKFIANEISHGDIRSLLNSALRTEINREDIWIEEVFDTFFIYEDQGKLFKRTYTVVDGKVGITETAVEVVRVVEFRTLDGKFVGNRKDEPMDKKKLVDGLIANADTSWEESDRETLMAMNEATLSKIGVVKNEESTSEAGTEATVEATEATEAKVEATEVISNMTVDKYLETQVPAEIKGVLQNALSLHNQTKNQLITDLVANKKCTFTEVFLQTKDIEELTNLKNLGMGEDVEVQPVSRFNYAGQGGGQLVQSVEVGGEPLETLSVVA